MPQHLGRRPGGRPSTALVALVLALAALVVPGAHAPTRGATASDAARDALAAAHAVDVASLHVARFGGSGRWQTGTVAVPAGMPAAREEEPRVFLYVARRQGDVWTAAIEGTPRFAEMAVLAGTALAGTTSADLLATTMRTANGSGLAELSLPWTKGSSWRLTGGPHPFNGGRSRPWSSLDFGGPRPGVSALVRSARGGIVVRPCANMVQVRHAGGWTTSYYHVRDVLVRAGQSIGRGAALGYTSQRAGCGGWASAPHVHFSLLRYGDYVNIRGHAIGGWKVYEGSSPYRGCLVKATVRRCAPSGGIYNDGSIGND